MNTPELPHLEIVQLDALLVHEWHDDQRTPPLVERIANSGVFRNPPIVTPTLDRTQRYVVLDGANRTAALTRMGFPHVLVQIVQPGDPGLRLRTWNHILLNLPTGHLIARLKAAPNLDIVSSEDEQIDLPSQREAGVALIQTPDEKVFALSTPVISLEGRITALNYLVNAYKSIARMDRTSLNEVKQLLHLYPGLCALVIFPKFNITELIQLAQVGCLLPTGITRTTITPRALYVNLPLDYLSNSAPLDEKNVALEALLQKRMAQGKIVYQAEATVMFDE